MLCLYIKIIVYNLILYTNDIFGVIINNSMRVEDIKFKKIKAEDMSYYNQFYELRDNRTCDSVSLESFIWKDFHNVKIAIVERDGKDIGLIWLMGVDEEVPYSAMPLCKEEDLKYCFDLTVEYFNKILNKKFINTEKMEEKK